MEKALQDELGIKSKDDGRTKRNRTSVEKEREDRRFKRAKELSDKMKAEIAAMLEEGKNIEKCNNFVKQ